MRRHLGFGKQQAGMPRSSPTPELQVSPALAFCCLHSGPKCQHGEVSFIRFCGGWTGRSPEPGLDGSRAFPSAAQGNSGWHGLVG